MKTAEEIKKGLEMCGVIRGRCKGCPYYGEAECVSNHSADALAYIQQLEAIDAEPVRRGKWIHDINNLYGCSERRARETMSPKKLKNYCPNCGAKMDLEVQDD